jgi:hypothetical protein
VPGSSEGGHTVFCAPRRRNLRAQARTHIYKALQDLHTRASHRRRFHIAFELPR